MRRTSMALAALMTALLLTAAPSGAAVSPKKVDAGGYTSCSLMTNDTVYCWGDGSSGALGDGQDHNSNVPVKVINLSKVKQVSVSESPCALKMDGTVWCWGNGSNGELGNDDVQSSNVPVRVVGINNARYVTSGYQHACAVLGDGRIKCWGDNADGQLGNGQSGNTKDTPVYVKNISDAVQVDAGNEYHTCAKLSTGKVKCWGLNDDGQLGDDSFDSSSTPVSVKGLGQVRKVVVGYYETCALMMDRSVKCWGENDNGELGMGETGGSYDTPQSVVGVANVKTFAYDYDTGCAALMNGNIKCWGVNDGKWGNGSAVGANTAVAVPGTDVKGMGGGWYHTCIIHENSSIQCSGNGGSGELGNGFDNTSDIWVDVIF